MTINDLSTVKPGINQLLVKLPKLNDKISISNGKPLFIDISYEPGKHVNVYGEVIALPTKLYFNPNDHLHTLDFEPVETIQVGDIVYFDYFQAVQSMGDLIDPENATEPKHVEYNGEVYIFLTYSAVYFSKRNDKIVPANGYTICEQLADEDTPVSDTIIIPDSVKKNKSAKYAKVLYPGQANKRYLSGKVDGLPVAAGDIIIFQSNSDRHIENDLHQSFRKGKQILAIQGQWIMGKFTNPESVITLDENKSK